MSELKLFHFPPIDNNQPDPSKPIIILIHGGALSHRMYTTTIPHLTSHGHSVYAPDRPGHGTSTSLGPFTFSTSTTLLSRAITTLKTTLHPATKILLVGISLGGQTVLSLLSSHPSLANSAIISGVSIHPPNSHAQFEIPHLPSSPEWTTIFTEDINLMGMENAKGVQEQSFAFTFTPTPSKTNTDTEGDFPPVLVLTGEHDVAMAKRDFDELASLTKGMNESSECMVIKGAWHNHSIDIPEEFARVIEDWARKSVVVEDK